jgi:hypothetical protein
MVGKFMEVCSHSKKKAGGSSCRICEGKKLLLTVAFVGSQALWLDF